MRVEILEQADERVLAGFHRRRAEAEREHERAVRRAQIDLAGEGDVAVLGALVGPDQPLVGAAVPAIRPRTPTNPTDRASHGAEDAKRERDSCSRSASSIGVPL